MAPELGPGPPTWSAGFLPVGLGGFGRKLRFDVSPVPRFQPLQHFSASGLTNQQRPNGAGQLFVVDCGSGALALYRLP
jgi:hypothetical protein